MTETTAQEAAGSTIALWTDLWVDRVRLPGSQATTPLTAELSA